MATYIGYYHPSEDYLREQGATARANGGVEMNPIFRQKVIDLRSKLPKSIKLIGSYTPIGRATAARPAVWIAETDDPSELTFINSWYEGFLVFDWVPATVVGATTKATTTALDAATARR